MDAPESLGSKQLDKKRLASRQSFFLPARHAGFRSSILPSALRASLLSVGRGQTAPGSLVNLRFNSAAATKKEKAGTRPAF